MGSSIIRMGILWVFGVWDGQGFLGLLGRLVLGIDWGEEGGGRGGIGGIFWGFSDLFSWFSEVFVYFTGALWMYVCIFEGGRFVGVFWVFDVVCGNSWGMCVLFTVHLIYIEWIWEKSLDIIVYILRFDTVLMWKGGIWLAKKHYIRGLIPIIIGGKVKKPPPPKSIFHSNRAL